jgi:23S rRNA (uracil1939-C5)-methyltransferase
MQNPEILIESLDQEGRGVGRSADSGATSGATADTTSGTVPGKVIFVEGGLIGERVRYSSYRKKPSYENAIATEILRASAERAIPACPHFGVCGGCAMQHLDGRAQVAVKQRVLEDNLWHIGKLKPNVIYRAIHGPSWAYRHRARLSVRHVVKKGGVLVGFHERRSSFVADMRECHVLPRQTSDLLLPLRELIGQLSIRDKLPQIEVALGEDDHVPGSLTTVMVLRILEALSPDDESLLRQFADQHQVHFWLQTKGPDTVVPFYPPTGQLAYGLPEFGISMPFRPTDFTQVNAQINRVLVSRALKLLQPQAHERIADLFCGLGNFTLPIATLAREVVGIEGSALLTQRALDNAVLNGLVHKTSFATANLFEASLEQFKTLGRFDKMLIDPPREGALEVAKVILQLGPDAPSRIVYVSCNPSTLARDAAVLVHDGGYALRGAGVVNMFPQTAHVESIAVFEKPVDPA